MPNLKSGSQKQRILELLQSNLGQRVPLPRLLDLQPRISDIHARVCELRKSGYDISNGAYEGQPRDHRWYCLNGRRTVVVHRPDVHWHDAVQTSRHSDSARLFDIEQQEHRDLG